MEFLFEGPTSTGAGIGSYSVVCHAGYRQKVDGVESWTAAGDADDAGRLVYDSGFALPNGGKIEDHAEGMLNDCMKQGKSCIRSSLRILGL
eukprot:tig00020603_g11805.t1